LTTEGSRPGAAGYLTQFVFGPAFVFVLQHSLSQIHNSLDRPLIMIGSLGVILATPLGIRVKGLLASLFVATVTTFPVLLCIRLAWTAPLVRHPWLWLSLLWGIMLAVSATVLLLAMFHVVELSGIGSAIVGSVSAFSFFGEIFVCLHTRAWRPPMAWVLDGPHRWVVLAGAVVAGTVAVRSWSAYRWSVAQKRAWHVQQSRPSTQLARALSQSAPSPDGAAPSSASGSRPGWVTPVAVGAGCIVAVLVLGAVVAGFQQSQAGGPSGRAAAVTHPAPGDAGHPFLGGALRVAGAAATGVLVAAAVLLL
jgi:hypothetical protein